MADTGDFMATPIVNVLAAGLGCRSCLKVLSEGQDHCGWRGIASIKKRGRSAGYRPQTYGTSSYLTGKFFGLYPETSRIRSNTDVWIFEFSGTVRGRPLWSIQRIAKFSVGSW
jgi:hypothetical protein